MICYFARVATLYYDGFRSMVLGRTLWTIVLVKLLLIYAVVKLFFPDYLETRFATEQERADHVLTVLAGTDGNTVTHQHP